MAAVKWPADHKSKHAAAARKGWKRRGLRIEAFNDWNRYANLPTTGYSRRRMKRAENIFAGWLPKNLR